VIVVEGYIDAIMLAQAGFKETAASLGTALTADQLRALARYTRDVRACFDGDEAGRKASLRALEVFLEAGLLARGVFLPAGFDPDRLVRERGADAFGALLDEAELLIDYFFRRQLEESDNSAAGRVEVARRVAELLRKVRDRFQFDQLARRAADFGIDEHLLREFARSGASPPPRGRAGPVLRYIETDAGAKAEIGLVALAMLHPELRAQAKSAVRLGDIEPGEPARIVLDMPEGGSAGAELVAEISQRLSPEQQGALSALMVDPTLDNLEAARALVEDYLATLQRRRVQREVEALRRSAATSDDPLAAAQALIELRRGADGRK
jgi:DNA primase